MRTNGPVLQGDSQVYWFEGGFSEYEENHKKRVGDIIPHRLKYKKLVGGCYVFGMH